MCSPTTSSAVILTLLVQEFTGLRAGASVYAPDPAYATQGLLEATNYHANVPGMQINDAKPGVVYALIPNGHCQVVLLIEDCLGSSCILWFAILPLIAYERQGLPVSGAFNRLRDLAIAGSQPKDS